MEKTRLEDEEGNPIETMKSGDLNGFLEKKLLKIEATKN